MAGHVVKVSVVADTQKFSRAFRGLARETGLTGLANAGKAAIGVLARVGAAAGAAAAAIGAKSIAAAADLEQSTGAIEAVFKGAADEMKAFASQASTAVGLTKNEYQELGTLLGAQLKNAGTPMSELAGKTNDLIGLGADMAAMFGGTTADAVGALSSALKGERDPIERYGVSLKQAAIDAKAAELGFQKVGGSFDQEAQAAATLALIMEQTADAHGAFGRESDTFAHQVQVLKAQIGDLTAQLGTYLLPYATAAAKALTERLGPAVESLKGWIEGSLIPALRGMADTLGPKIQAAISGFETTVLPVLQQVIQWIGQNAPPAFERLVSLIQNFGPALLAGLAGFKAMMTGVAIFKRLQNALALARTAMLALNGAMAANPIGLIVAAIAALVAGLVYAYQHSETFRNIVQSAFSAIASAAGVVVTWFQTTFLPAFQSLWGSLGEYVSAAWTTIQGIWATIGQPIFDIIVTVIQGLAANWSAIWSGIQTVASGVWQIITSVISTAIGVIQGIIQFFTAVLQGDWSGAWQAIQNIAASIWNGIKGVIGGAINIVQGYISTALAVIQGIWNGAWNAIGNLLSGAWNGIKNAVTSSLNSVVNTLRSLPGKALGALGNVGSILTSAGRNLMEGFINGIKSMIGSVQSTLSDLTSKLTSWKGPESLDKVLLTPAGRYVIEGFIRGLESRYDNVRASLRGLTGDIAATPMPTLTTPTITPTLTTPTTTAGEGLQVTINVNALTPTPEVGRVVEQALEDWWRRNGGQHRSVTLV